MKKIVLLFVLLGLISFVTILKVENSAKKKVTTFYFIRHAEKESDGTRDPELSELGKQRAINYIKYFKKIKIDSIFSTNFKRTLNTVKPLASTLGLEPILYSPYKMNHKAFVENHKDQTILIVGHSNTTPDFANKIIEKMTYSQMTEDNFSDIYKVTIKDDVVKSKLLKMK